MMTFPQTRPEVWCNQISSKLNFHDRSSTWIIWSYFLNWSMRNFSSRDYFYDFMINFNHRYFKTNSYRFFTPIFHTDFSYRFFTLIFHTDFSYRFFDIIGQQQELEWNYEHVSNAPDITQHFFLQGKHPQKQPEVRLRRRGEESSPHLRFIYHGVPTGYFCLRFL